MVGDTTGHDNDLLERESVRSLGDCPEMAIVDRIERPAEDPDNRPQARLSLPDMAIAQNNELL